MNVVASPRAVVRSFQPDENRKWYFVDQVVWE